MKRTLGIYLRGMAMGAADLVPGVSGGTVALITGIYDELLQAISAVNPQLLTAWKSDGFRGIWHHINGPFIVALAAGIATSIVGLSGMLHHLLEFHRSVLYAFFFGLVAASIPMVGTEIRRRNIRSILAFTAGALVTFSVGSLPPLTVEPSLLYLFACGAVAACAMILPGISGSFILLLLGVYSHVIAAIKSLDLITVAAVGAGAASGLIGFSHLLRGWLNSYYNTVMSLLTGLLLGSLQALWPWKENALLLYTHSDGRETWLQTNALPDPSELVACVAWCLVGAALVWSIHRIAQRFNS